MSTTKTFPITGMHCAGCARNLTTTISQVTGVKKVNVAASTEKATITYDPKQIDWKQLKQTVSKIGNYQIILSDNIVEAGLAPDHKRDGHRPSPTQPHGKHHDHAAMLKQQELQTLKRKLIISVILTTPLLISMLVHIPNEIAFVLTSIVLFYSGKEFFQNTWKGLQARVANMDTLIALGTGSAYVYSTVATFWPSLLVGNADLRSLHNQQPHVYFETAAVIVTLILLGRYLEARAKGKAGAAIKSLMQLQAKMARVLTPPTSSSSRGSVTTSTSGIPSDIDNWPEQEIPIEQIEVGDYLVVKPGEKIPIDGNILKGKSYVDESLVTGESKPVKKQPGDTVIGSTINSRGRLIITATQVGEGTMLAKIIHMVEAAQTSQAPIQKLADQVAAIFVPAVIAIAILAFIIWFAVIGVSFTSALTIFITVLIISCPCALGLATPISIMVGTGRGAQKGILIKNAEKLQITGKIDAIALDKTGTLTQGNFAVTDMVTTDNWDNNKLLRYAAALEANSEHPIASAIIDKYNHTVGNGFKPSHKKTDYKSAPTKMKVANFKTHEGKGVSGNISKKKIKMGTAAFVGKIQESTLQEQIEKLKTQGETIAYIKVDQKIVGAIALADEPKPTAKQTINQLQAMNIDTWMITGDNSQTAIAVGKQLGISKDNIFAAVLPQDKAKAVWKLQNQSTKSKINTNLQNSNHQNVVWNLRFFILNLFRISDLEISASHKRVIAFVGDGVNDAPALAQANVGIAMATGTDVAIETADITLLRGDISLIAEALTLSKKTMTNIKQNLFWAFGYNAILIPVAAGVLIAWGIQINPMFASAAMAFSSISVVMNALRLKKA